MRKASRARSRAARALGAAFAVACLCGAVSWATSACSGWDPTSPFEHNSPDVDRAIADLDAGNFRAAEDILEEYLATGPCSDAGIGLPDTVKLKPNGTFDLGLTLFYLAESFGHPFGEEEEGLEGPGSKKNARLRGMEIDCAMLVTLAISSDPHVPIEVRARAHYLAGNLEFLRRRYEEAVKHYDETLSLVPGIVEEAGGDDIGRDAAWNRAIALRRIPLVPLAMREREPDGGESQQDGSDGSDGPDGSDGSADAQPTTPDDAGDAAADAAQDAGSGKTGREPPVVLEPEPATPDPQSDDRILDQLEQAPTYQEQEAKNRGTKRGRIRMEDK